MNQNSSQYLFALLAVIGIFLRVQPAVSQQTAQPGNASHSFGYLQYLPAGYNDPANATKKYPLIVFLHGIDERGNGTTELNRVDNTGLPALLASGSIVTPAFNFVVISPQLSTASPGYWTAAKTHEVMTYVLSNYRVHADSVFLTGLSLGGEGTLVYLSSANPVNIAAAAVMSAPSITRISASLACNMKDVPLRVWHNVWDTRVGYNNSTTLVKNIDNCDPSPAQQLPVFITKRSSSHDAWTDAYNDPLGTPNGLYDWFKGAPAVSSAGYKLIHVSNSTPVTSFIPGAARDLNHSIVSYQWSPVAPTTATYMDGTTTNDTLRLKSLVPGTYTFRLTATNNAGQSVSNDVMVEVNTKPVANAGPDKTITLPVNSVSLAGAGTDADGNSIIDYSWSTVSTPAGSTPPTLVNPDNDTLVVNNLSAGTYVFRLVVQDSRRGLSTGNDVTVTVNSSTQVWHSYDVAMQSNPAQQGVVTGSGSTPATIEFYQSVTDLGVDKGSLFSQYNPGNHPNAATAATSYWANGTGAVYPYAGKSTVGRGSEPGEGNVPPPAGVIDLQLHPPNNSKLTVAAFVVPVSGTYSVSNLAARRTATGGNGVDYQVFNKDKALVVTLKAGTNQDWVQDTVTSRSLGSLAAGDRIYFSVYRQISDYSDHTEVAWTITLTGASARTAFAAGAEPATRAHPAVRVSPNPGNNLIGLSGVGKRGTVRVYDALGRLQASKPFTSAEGRVELSAGALPPGLYYLSVQSDGKLSRHKWLKQ